MEPRFLELAEVLEIHRDPIERYGGAEEIRDLGLLQSAIAMPQAGTRGAYLHVDLFEMAAAYLYHLVCNPPFVDGNKRTGTAAALVFLELHGVRVEVDDDELAETVEAVAAGKLAKSAVTQFLRAHGREQTRRPAKAHPVQAGLPTRLGPAQGDSERHRSRAPAIRAGSACPAGRRRPPLEDRLGKPAGRAGTTAARQVSLAGRDRWERVGSRSYGWRRRESNPGPATVPVRPLRA